MRTGSPTSLQLSHLMLLVFSATTEALFFHSPHRLVMDIIEKLGGHKHESPVHHYHMHYYPLPVPLVLPRPVPLPPPPPPPHKYELELSALHGGYGHAHDWHGRGNNYQDLDLLEHGTPSSSWSGPEPQWDSSQIYDKDHEYKEAKSPGISLQVPFHQHVVVYQQPAKESKWKLLKAFLSKLRRLNDALFHPEDEVAEVAGHDHLSPPHLDNSLAYHG